MIAERASAGILRNTVVRFIGPRRVEDLDRLRSPPTSSAPNAEPPPRNPDRIPRAPNRPAPPRGQIGDATFP